MERPALKNRTSGSRCGPSNHLLVFHSCSLVSSGCLESTYISCMICTRTVGLRGFTSLIRSVSGISAIRHRSARSITFHQSRSQLAASIATASSSSSSSSTNNSMQQPDSCPPKAFKSWPKIAVGQMTSVGDTETNYQTCKRLTEV